MSWTDDDIEKLKKLWSEGHSTAEIGRLIGKSKNAVVGKAHRLNLAARPSPIKKSAVTPKAIDSPKSAPISMDAPVEMAPVNSEAVVGNSKVKTAQGPSCQWPYGHPDDPSFKFCLRPVVPGKPYCAEHCQIAYIPANRKGEAREAERRAQLMAAEGQKIGWASELSAAPKVPGDAPIIPRMFTAALDEDFSEVAKQDMAEARAKQAS
ncbi:MAG: GcrA family cell cycle regulator [Alphaproteobacteria bacterium]